MLKVLSTKLLDKSLIDSAREIGIALTCVDLISIQNVSFDTSLTSGSDAVVFTSSNAVKSFFENVRLSKSSLGDSGIKQVFALSGKTKDELAHNGIISLAVADSAALLADMISADSRIRSVLHICGNLKLDTLENKLRTSGIECHSLIVYETILTGIKMDQTFDAIMFYSPSGVDSFLIKNKLNKDTLYCCIGATTAEKLQSIDQTIDVILPAQPAPYAMLTAIRDLKKPKDI